MKTVDTFKEIIQNAKNLSIEQIQVLIGMIFQEIGYGSIVQMNQTFNGLYRSRKHEQIDGQNEGYLFTNEKEFWNPPPEKVNNLGRCNEVNESMFYSSNHFETSMLEVRPEEGNFITVSHFRPINHNGLLPSFRIKPICIQHLKKIEGYGHLISDSFLANRDRGFIEVDKLIDNLFLKEVNENFEYKITNAITKCMLVNLINKKKEELNMGGMVYPSIANNNKSLNVLLKPYYAMNYFQIKLLQTFKVLKSTNERTIIKLVRNGYPKGYKKHPSEKLDIIWLPEVDGDITEIT